MNLAVGAARPTRIHCELVGGSARFSVLDQGDHLAARPVHAPATAGPRVHLRVALIGISMMLLGGDDVVIEVRVGPGVVLEIVEPAGLVAYDADGEPSCWSLHAVVGEGGALIWDGAPFVAAAGSNARRSTEVTLASGARALVREMLVLGRTGEDGGRLRSITRVTGPEGEMLVEDLDLSGPLRRAVGVLGASRVMAAVTATGWRPPADDATAGNTLQLARAGSVRRVMGAAAHEVDALLGGTHERWKDDLLAGQP